MHERLIMILVAILAMIAPFSIDTYLPSFPDIQADLHATPLQMQQTLSIYMLGFGVMTLFYGSLTDALGRRVVILFALIGYIVTSIVAALIDNIHGLLLMRLGQGIFASAGIVVGRAVVRDVFHGSRAQEVMSVVMLIFGIAPAFAPIIGGILEIHWGWRSVFIFLALLGAAVLLLVLTQLQETLPKAQRHSMHPVILLKNYAHALGKVHFLELALIIAFCFGGFFLYIASAPHIIFQHLGMGEEDFSVLFVPLIAGMMLGAYLAKRAAGRWSVRRSLQLGFSVMFIAALLNVAYNSLFPVSLPGVVVPVVLYGVGMSFCMPMLTILGLDELPRHRGLASSLQSFVHMVMNAVVAGMVAPLVFDKVQHLALAMLCLNGVALLLFLNVFRRKPLEYVVDQP